MKALLLHRAVLFAAALAAGLALGYAGGWHALASLHHAPQKTVAVAVSGASASSSASSGSGEAAGHAGQAKEVARTPYVRIGQFVVPIISEGSTRAFVLAEIALDTGSTEKSPEIENSLPQYRDAVLQALYAEAGAGAFDGSNFNLAALSANVFTAIRRAVPGTPVRKVLFDRLLLQANTAS